MMTYTIILICDSCGMKWTATLSVDLWGYGDISKFLVILEDAKAHTCSSGHIVV